MADVVAGGAVGSPMDRESVVPSFETSKVLDRGDVRPGAFDRLYRPVLNQVQDVERAQSIPQGGPSGLAALRDSQGGAPGDKASAYGPWLPPSRSDTPLAGGARRHAGALLTIW